LSKLNNYGRACALFVLLLATAAVLSAQGFKVLHSFDGTDGSSSWGEMLQGADGNFYGTSQNGGNGSCNMGCGTVFKITPDGTLTTLHSFADSPDGALPFAGLVQAANGDLYGVTLAGGTSANCSPNGAHGCGTVFKITLSGTLTTLHSFTGADGNGPGGPLLLASDGNYYGTTGGGALYGGGTAFKITPSGTLTTLHAWSGPEGYSPTGALIQGQDGNLYGTTFTGGANTNGNVFKMTLSGAVTSLHIFNNTNGDGAYPYAGLVQGSDGDFYGTTETGGTYLYYGCVYKITAEGVVTILHSFNVTDGDIPTGNLIQTSNGDFYGTTPYGGVNNDGTIFVISSSGAFTTLHSFDITHGSIPYGGLVQTANGDLYATTFSGGSTGCGGYGCGTFVRLDLRVAHVPVSSN
jgi:uncharacterized repeat protein (TIGR03803 family)